MIVVVVGMIEPLWSEEKSCISRVREFIELRGLENVDSERDDYPI